MEVNGDTIYGDSYQGQEINSEQPESMYKEWYQNSMNVWVINTLPSALQTFLVRFPEDLQSLSAFLKFLC